MLSKLTIGNKLMGTTAAMFILAAIQGYSGLHTASSFKDQFDNAVDVAVRKVVLADQVDFGRLNMVSAQRAEVLSAFSKDRTVLEKSEQEYQQSVETIQKSVDEMRPLIVKDEAKVLLAEIVGDLSQWRPMHEDLLRQAQGGHAAEADRIRTELTVPVYKKIAVADARLQAIQKETLAAAKTEVDGQNTSARQVALGLLGLCLLLTCLIALIVRGITRDVRRAVLHLGEGAEQVTSAAVQVSAASQSLAQGASEQAASLEETSSSSEEISSMTRKNAENSKIAADVTSQVNERVTAANQSLDQMVVSMTEINTSSDKVSKIIKVIDEIAFQTNILALNAAVEAARAGEAGMGFAVVADEVRNLAQRCAQAAKDTAALIEESLTKSHDGMAKLDHVTGAIRSITESAVKVKTLVDEVHLGSEEQARGIEQIAKAIAQMEQVTQKTAANAEESASASEELSAQAESMRAVVTELQSMVGGGAQGAGKEAPATPRPPSTGSTARVLTQANGRSMSGDLASLRSAVSHKSGARPSIMASVAAARADRSELPLDEDFKEF